MRIRTLTDPSNGKLWESRLDADGTLSVRTGSGRRLQTTVKSAIAAADALVWAETEERKRLKQGYRLLQPDARAGEPRLHVYRSPLQSGALPAAAFEGQLVCNCWEDTARGDRLFLLAADGERRWLPAYPEPRLSWKCVAVPALHALLVNADHQILCWRAEAADWIALTPRNPKPASCLQVAAGRAVWYAPGELVVHDLVARRDLLRLPIEAGLYRGHSTQMEAALSPDGETVLCCAQPGEIGIWEVASGRSLGVLRDDFEMVQSLTVIEDGHSVLLMERYGRSSLRCYDLQTRLQRTDWRLARHDARAALALSPDGRQLALADGPQVEIHDLTTQESLLRFRIEHCVQRCALSWVGDWLGVLTDTGCASLYALG